VAHTINANYDDHGVDVYQAFEARTVEDAVRLQRFGAGFGLDRMTWIKPSFGWMLYRSGYATKHGQDRIARVTIRHAGFLEALTGAVPSSYQPELYASQSEWSIALKRSDARYQWDPDRDLALRPLPRRALQLGISGSLIRRYAAEWIIRIADVTDLAHAIRDAVAAQRTPPEVPIERAYPVPPAIARQLGVA
jgi:hypothetical protein